MAKCKQVHYTKAKYQSCLKVITDFCGHFVTDISLPYRWVGLKPFGHPTMEFFVVGVGFSWRAYKDLRSGFTFADSVMGPFMAIVGTTTLLTVFDERGITYLATTNAGWLPYLADKGISIILLIK